MILAKVLSPVVMTAKHLALAREKILLVKACDARGEPSGTSFMAIDRAQAGEGDRVLVLREGSGVRQILERKDDPVPINALIVGIVDEVTHV
jgi:microcompartment protein CcmK/EutM